jgi:hypothetical protein
VIRCQTITGYFSHSDLTTISPNFLTSDHGVNLIKVYDQDNHDIDKCLDSISKLPEVAPDIQVPIFDSYRALILLAVDSTIGLPVWRSLRS